jgi:glycerol-3-phosphate dehydrogenase
LVPIRTVTVIGTTDGPVADPDDTSIPPGEVAAMLDAGERLIPGFRRARALRVWAGVRPLWADADRDGDVASTRDVSRAHALLDHRERDGIAGIVTITGGKLTTYRLMAQDAVDAACAALGRGGACTTATTTLPGAQAGEPLRPSARLRARERALGDDQLVCECELVTRAQVRDAVARTDNLDDVRRELRLGMGPCQGGFCMVRAAGLMHESGDGDPAAANAALRAFVDERWKGIWPVLHGDQLRQAWLDDWIHHGLLGVGELPEGSARGATEEPPGVGTGPGTESRP